MDLNLISLVEIRISDLHREAGQERLIASLQPARQPVQLGLIMKRLAARLAHPWTRPNQASLDQPGECDCAAHA
jgi:hypothetical protein